MFYNKKKSVCDKTPTEKFYASIKRASTFPENTLIIGASGSGKCHHPWDNLKPCICGCKERPLLMYNEEEVFYCGGNTDNVFAICPVCKRQTEKTYIVDAIRNWNKDNVN